MKPTSIENTIIMLEAIQSNPYRILGVYSNSPKKDVVANKGKMTAFLKVGRSVSFPLDLSSILPSLERNGDIVAKADAELSLPGEQIKHGQFWFIKTTPFDDIAFNHLLAGDMAGAMDVWAKKSNMSSLQNRLVCFLIKAEYSQAIDCAEQLYANHSTELVSAIAGDTLRMSSNDLIKSFLDTLTSSSVVDTSTLFLMINNGEWKSLLGDQLVAPLIQQIEEAITEAKRHTDGGAQENLKTGTKLMNSTKPLLKQLKGLLPTSDLQYQMIVDKLGLQILQCGINYYNDSDDEDAPHKAMKLQKYAQSIVVGSMAKDRCAENTKILQKIIDRLPPKEVMEEYRAIINELEAFCKRPDKIMYAKALLKNTKPHLDAMKAKLQTLQYSAVGNLIKEKHLELSTQIVGNALHNLIEEVNAVQEDARLNLYLDREGTLDRIRKTLREAWEATMLMDAFEMEAGFKSNRYVPQKNSLKNLCSQLGISTSVIPSYQSLTTAQTTRSYSPSRTSSKSESNNGCLIWILIWVVASVIIGAMIAAGDGDFGVGFIVSGVVLSWIYRFFDN